MNTSDGMKSTERRDHSPETSVLVLLKLFSMIAFISLCFGCRTDRDQGDAQSKKIPESAMEAWVLTDSLFAVFGYDIAHVYDVSPLFDTIDSIQYSRLLKSRYSVSLKADSAGVHITEDSLVIYTAHSKLKYPGTRPAQGDTEPVGINAYSEYHGKIQGTGFYVLSGWTEGSILTGRMSLIDSNSNTAYVVGSVSDGGADAVLASPLEEFLLYYSNAYHVSGVGLLHYNKDTLPVLRQLCSFMLQGIIEEVFWTRNKRLVFKLKHRQRQNNWRDEYYYIASMPLNFSWYEYRNASGDSLDPVSLNQYLRYPFSFPYDSTEFLEPEIELASKDQYTQATSISLASVDTSGTRIQSRRYDFLIRTADSLYQFPKSSARRRERWYSVHKAYYPDHKLYEVYLVDGTHAIGQQLLIDSVTNQVIKPVSPFDVGLTNLRFSADGNYMAALSNSLYSPGSYLVIWRLERDESGILRLRYLVSHEMPEWNISDYKWVAPGRLLLETTRDIDVSEKERISRYYNFEVKLP